MYLQWKWIGIVLVLSTLLVGCGSTAQPQSSTTDPVNITLKTNPTVPAVGKTELIFDLQDGNNQPLTEAIVDVSADHTDMSGMTMGGITTEQGNGKYAITADFSMSGTWKITVNVRKENLDFKKDFKLIIP